MRAKFLISFFVSAALFLQCSGVNEVNVPPVQSNDLESLLQETRQLISTAYQEGYALFQNISQTAASVVPEIKQRAVSKVQEINAKYSDQYEKIKTRAIGANMDVNLCMEFFELSEDTLDSDLSVLDDCFTDKIESFMNTLYDYHRTYNEEFLKVLYKIDINLMSCASTKCHDDLRSTLDDTRTVLPGTTSTKLLRSEKELTEYLKEIEVCGEKTFAMSEAAKLPLVKGFEKCFENEIRLNKVKKEPEEEDEEDDEEDDDEEDEHDF